MIHTFEVLNVKCGGCANTLSSKLTQQFGKVTVNLEVEPRQITLNIEESNIPALRIALKNLGYPMIDEDLSTVEEFTTTAKSFVSCAVGKISS